MDPSNLRVAPRRRSPKPAQVFVGAVIAAGFAAAVASGVPVRDPRFWYWAAACAAGEMLWLRLPLGRATMSMGSTANFAALLVLPTPIAIPAAALASLTMERTAMRKPLVRALFNAAGTALAMGATGMVLRLMAPHGVFELHNGKLFLALVSAAIAYYVFNRSLVTAVLALDGALPISLVWRRNFGFNRDLLPSGAAMSLGVLLAELHQQVGPMALLFAVLPVLIVFQAQRRMYSSAVVRANGRTPGLIEMKRAVNE